MAGNIRARLETKEKEVAVGKPHMELVSETKTATWDPNKKVAELDRLSFGKPIRLHVQEFACVFAIIAFVAASYLLYKHNDLFTATVLCGVGALLILLGYRVPQVLLPLWKGWMALAHVLGTAVTFLILSFMWALVALPIALLLRVVGKHVMDLRYDKSIKSYWDEREDKYHNFKLLERQF